MIEFMRKGVVTGISHQLYCHFYDLLVCLCLFSWFGLLFVNAVMFGRNTEHHMSELHASTQARHRDPNWQTSDECIWAFIKPVHSLIEMIVTGQ